MNTTAYLVCWFEVKNGIPTFWDVGVYSEDSRSLTSTSARFAADVAESGGRDFGDAIRNLRALCERVPSLRWALPLADWGPGGDREVVK